MDRPALEIEDEEIELPSLALAAGAAELLRFDPRMDSAEVSAGAVFFAILESLPPIMLRALSRLS